MGQFDHDDLMFASRIAGLRRKPRRAAGGDFAGDFAAAGGEDPLLRVLVGAALAERQQRQADALQRAAEAERFNRERSATQEDADTKWQRALQAQVAANRRADEVGARQRGYAVEDRVAGLKERSDERKHTEGREDARDKTGRIRQLTDYVAQARANGDDLAPELLAELEQLTGTPHKAAASAGGLNRIQREALTNAGLQRVTRDLEAGNITEAQAMERIGQLRDPAAALRTAAPPPRTTPAEDLTNVVDSNLAEFSGKTQDTDVNDLFGGEGSFKGMADPERAAAMDRSIERLLREGKSPEEIGWMARESIRQQKHIDPTTLDTEGIFELDKGGETAWHQYGERFRRRAAELRARLSAPANAG